MHSLLSHGHDGSRSWLLHHAGQTNATNEWAQAAHAMSGALRSLDGEKAEAFGMPHMISGVGFERPLQLPLWYISVFFALARCRVVKIAHSRSEVVLRTTKHAVIYPSSGPSLEVIALRPAI
jgi:hypothetical protein